MIETAFVLKRKHNIPSKKDVIKRKREGKGNEYFKSFRCSLVCVISIVDLIFSKNNQMSNMSKGIYLDND
jgi:hypothetical protein